MGAGKNKTVGGLVQEPVLNIEEAQRESESVQWEKPVR